MKLNRIYFDSSNSTETMKDEPYRIEKDIPIPPQKRRSRYPFEDMAVGDSFIVPVSKRNSLAGSISRFQNFIDSSKEFTYRQMDDGYRVWRTK
jgi:hypothetical protein